MRLHEDQLDPPGLYAWVEKSPGAVIVPLEDDGVWLVEQYRHPVRRRVWEFPQGAWEDAPDAPAEALARGELAEETGLRAASMERLGSLFYAYGILDQPFGRVLPPFHEHLGHALELTAAERLEARTDGGTDVS